MATTSDAPLLGRALVNTWNLGVGAGIAAVIPMMAFNMAVVGSRFTSLFGLLPFAVLWGFLYAVVASTDRLAPLAAAPTTGAGVGLVYSVLVWMGPQVGEPLGQGVFTINGAIQVAVFGVVLGVVYAASTDA